MAATPTIPPGYDFFNPETLLSDRGREILEGLLKKAANRNPDAFDMYIYNDFYAYAVLDLVDKILSTLHSKITKKAYKDAFYIVEGLTVFFDCEPSWPTCDDGERVMITDKAYGALVVALLSGLEKEGSLDITHFPGLEGFLMNIAEWGRGMRGLSCKSGYDRVCKAIGEKLFKVKSPDDLALEKARLEEWINKFPAEDQDEIRKKIEKDAEERALKEPWYVGGMDVASNTIVLSRVWKEYKQYISGVPKRPARGPATWDISKWSTAQKKEFEFGSDDGFSDV